MKELLSYEQKTKEKTKEKIDDQNHNLLFGKINKNKFFEEYWEKKPLLIRAAFPTISEYADHDDFTSFATNEDFESRMIVKEGAEYPWQLRQGPFTDEVLSDSKLKKTLLCHGLNLHHPDFHAVKNQFHFLPAFLFDDIMASISDPGADCGAHVDKYNVFIVQGQGKRQWLLQENPVVDYIEDIEVKLLKEFTPNLQCELNPGDMLYIPASVAHHGISDEKSLSYSVGMKAFTSFEVVSEIMKQKIESESLSRTHIMSWPQDKKTTESLNELNQAMSEINQEDIYRYLSLPKDQNFSELGETRIAEEKIDEYTEIQKNAYAALSPVEEKVYSLGHCFEYNETKVIDYINTIFWEESFTINELMKVCPDVDQKKLTDFLSNLLANEIIYHVD